MANRDSHENLQRNHGFKASSPTRFGTNMTLIFSLITASCIWAQSPYWSLFLTLALLFLLAAIFIPYTLAPVNQVWTAFGLFLARFTNPLILLAVYLFVFTPIALVYRAFSKESFHRKEKLNSGNWEMPSASSDLTKQY